nr:putative ribonuclease H-like domain-containing protein [Tanacetum cinerariifolium]
MTAVNDVLQLVDKKGGSYTDIAPKLEPGKFNKWKKQMLCYLAGMEPYYLKYIKDGPFQPKIAEGDAKPESQWTPDERRVIVQYQRLKSIIMSCLSDDIMESVISCLSAKETWIDLVHSFEADPKIQKDYKKMKSKLALLEASPLSSHNPKTFQPKNKGLVAKTFNWDDEYVSDEKEVTQVKTDASGHFSKELDPPNQCSSSAIPLTDISPMSINHEKYTLIIVDEHSRMVENQNDVKVKQTRTDNGTEFRNHKLESFSDEKGISQNFSSPYTREQNDVTEKKNRTLIEAARTMLNGSVLSKHFWTEASE